MLKVENQTITRILGAKVIFFLKKSIFISVFFQEKTFQYKKTTFFLPNANSLLFLPLKKLKK